MQPQLRHRILTALAILVVLIVPRRATAFELDSHYYLRFGLALAVG